MFVNFSQLFIDLQNKVASDVFVTLQVTFLGSRKLNPTINQLAHLHCQLAMARGKLEQPIIVL